MDERTVDRVLEYVGGRRVATPQHLVNSLGVSEADANAAAEELERNGWVGRGWARFIESPGPETETLHITPAGSEELARRDALANPGEEPLELTRDELVAQLRRAGMTDEQVMREPLTGTRFYFWSSVPAYAIKE